MVRNLVILITLLSVVSWYALAKTERVRQYKVEVVNITPDPVSVITDVIKTIKEMYVTNIDNENIIQSSVNGVLQKLDPYSGYFSQNDLKEMELHTSGELEGIGIEASSANGVVTVISAIEDSPSHKAGIKSGDKIHSINGEKAYRLSPIEVIKRIRGKENTMIDIGVLRRGVKAPIHFQIKRNKVRLNPVKSYLMGNRISYIRIKYFYGNTAKQVVKEIKKHKNLKGLILDLRNNPGGLLDQSVSVASIFIKDGSILHTKGRNKSKSITYNSDKFITKIDDIPVVVLINNWTASAAEVVAASLKDHNRATIIGSKSFGKGSIQEMFELDSGGAVILTTSFYYTPLGKSIDRIGVTPDIVAKENLINKAVDIILNSNTFTKTHK
jgi:carboxyl-terminal processing protease